MYNVLLRSNGCHFCAISAVNYISLDPCRCGIIRVRMLISLLVDCCRITVLLLAVYRVSQKRGNGRFSVLCNLKMLHVLISLDKISSSEKTDTKNTEFVWVVFILWPFLETRSFSIFV